AAAPLRQSLARSGGGALTTTGSAGVARMQPVAAHVHVVRPGETLWSIVRDSGIAGDPRPVVDQLARQAGDRPLQVGQRVVLPAVG
ncbi:MAG: LysM peptidoglycan-binding domain-containing protein, partial [Actinomycetota bacterium]|nr:LysM peptidoglycan-binding domain-containing protein [Actinomycetota bacterium]